ncbi:bsr0922 [Bradyrhizobium diazoefficiens USDA 110]|uniref:Bsr0922 protein n=1 Tax=Bradyrhizobium diazoefficiens (strain JCM 10833 / BCRC 13528 / IAM 13628 / NBRC 14792 / USDA 110) TaxID=224911 RepID=Q89VX3_BRADU|nr:hypothetical protein CO678_07210 [Bradyrhizobium diazoefficiens]QBP19863.1 hypothetical protein Bdiaspc4_04445 [Bradyrhizobium diazoefficiens]BAC46187.1 bsr0922 [Bradyrhizobium diazoefficiens USDA 110]
MCTGDFPRLLLSDISIRTLFELFPYESTCIPASDTARVYFGGSLFKRSDLREPLIGIRHRCRAVTSPWFRRARPDRCYFEMEIL